MENILAEQVSDALTGSVREVIVMNEKYYTIKRPKTKLLAKMLKPMSKIHIDEFNSKSDIPVLLKQSVEQYRYADEVIALVILGDRAFGVLSGLRLWRLKRILSMSSDAERYEAVEKIFNLIIPRCFFAYSRLMMELTGIMAKQEQE